MSMKRKLRGYMTEALAEVPRIDARCRHFGECGGCELQDIAHEAQVRAKTDIWSRLAADAGLTEWLDEAVFDTVQSPRAYGYRQRMDYVFAFGKAGLRKKGSHKWVVALEECHLIPPEPFAAFRRAHALAEELGLRCYNYLRHEGYLRYIVVRHTREKQTLLSLVTKTPDHGLDIERIARTLLDEGAATSVHWLLQEGLADLSFGESLRHFGQECIEETFGGKRFLVGPNTFFQANAWVAEEAYGRIRAFAESAPAEHILDLYSGTGVIAILLAHAADAVTAVENVPDNEILARRNLDASGVENARFLEADAEAFLRSEPEGFDFVAVNPPRVGVGPKAIPSLAAMGPARIAYMSCNPATLLEDLKALAPGYRPLSVTLLDMFPQTRHFEMLVTMERR